MAGPRNDIAGHPRVAGNPSLGKDVAGLTVDRILERLTGLELRLLRRLDLDFLTSPWITAFGRLAIDDAKCAKSDEASFAAPGQGAGDRSENRVHGLLGTCAGKPGVVSHCLYEILFIHRLVPFKMEVHEGTLGEARCSIPPESRSPRTGTSTYPPRESPIFLRNHAVYGFSSSPRKRGKKGK